MKIKILYIFVIISCLSFFSSAKQIMRTRDVETSCSTNKKKEASPAGTKNPGRTEFDLSPLKLFLFSI